MQSRNRFIIIIFKSLDTGLIPFKPGWSRRAYWAERQEKAFTAMTLENQKTVWIIGDPKDPTLKILQEESLAVGHHVVFEEDIGKAYYLESPDIIIYGYMSSKEPFPFGVAQLLELSDIKPHCAFLLTALGDLPLELAGEIDFTGQVIGFSAFALYLDRYVVELAPTMKTSPDILQSAKTFLEGIGMKPLEVRETPGLILPRVVSMLVNEAISALMEGIATAEEIDTAMKLGTNYPEGPLAWADKVGLDVIYQILSHLYDVYGEDRYRPMIRLRQMVAAGLLGVKTGQGFYTYPDSASPDPATPLASSASDMEKIATSPNCGQ